jgi:hypothetical protein
MRTIREPKKETFYHVECKNSSCAAIMECEEHELGKVHDQREGHFFVLLCPHCEKSSYYASGALKEGF